MKQILLLLLTTFSLSAQVKGVVLDSISGKPIAYVGVFTSKPELNFSADEKGKFEVEGFQKTDTLWFFTTGYQIKKILVKDVKKKIYLTPIKIEKIKDTIKKNSRSKTWMNLISNPEKFKTNIPSSTNLKAFYLNGIDTKDNRILIESIEVSALNLPNTKAILKLRFFEADSIQNIGNEIQNSAIITNIYNSILTSNFDKIVSSTNEISNVKLINENTVIKTQIIIPKQGLFIAFELMNFKDNYEIAYSDRKKYLFPIIESSNIKTKTYSFEKGKWILEEKNNFLPKIKISIIQEEN